MLKISLVIISIISIRVNAVTFDEAVKILEFHDSVESLRYKSKSEEAKGKDLSSWGDPIFKLSAKNFPVDTFSNDQTPMTGVGFGISQKIPVSRKYAKLDESKKLLSKATAHDALDKEEGLKRKFWELLILNKKLSEELKILKENLSWISKNLKVTKRLYSTGKVTQQALLEIQIRKSEIESEIVNKEIDTDQVKAKFEYLIGTSDIDDKTIPWSFLAKSSSSSTDNREIALQNRLQGSKYGVEASESNYIPDLTLSFEYTKRANIDGNGDFVSMAISFPLPFSDKSGSNNLSAVSQKYIAAKNYELYRRTKKRELTLLKLNIKKSKSELKTLNERTLKFAKNSFKITAKSYGLGTSSYIELLQSELKLQSILMQKTRLEAGLNLNRVSYKYLNGEPLNE